MNLVKQLKNKKSGNNVENETNYNDENSINYEINFDEKIGKSKIINQDIIKDSFWTN